MAMLRLSSEKMTVPPHPLCSLWNAQSTALIHDPSVFPNRIPDIPKGRPHHMPSSMPTFFHQGFEPSPAEGAALTLSATSPTCFRALISRLCRSHILPGAGGFNFFTLLAIVRLAILSPPPAVDLISLPARVNPWEEGRSNIIVFHSSLMTGRCHCSGSELELKRLRCRYTSVP